MFGRVAQYLANEVLVKALTQSKLFQSFAAKTHQGVTKVSEKGAHHVSKIQTVNVTEKLGKTVSGVKENVKAKAQPVSMFKNSLTQSFRKEFHKFDKALEQEMAKKNAPK